MYTLLLIITINYQTMPASVVIPNLSYQECTQQIANVKATDVVVRTSQCVNQEQQ